MKKFLFILLTILLGISCFACANNKPNVSNDSRQEEDLEQSSMWIAYDTFIQDSAGVAKCFWEDGGAMWDNYRGTERQTQKSAILTTQIEYDMWFAFNECDLELSNDEYYYPVEFEYDANKIEIKANPDKEHHFILKILKPCDKEKVTSKIMSKSPLDNMLNENGEPVRIPFFHNISITVSATE